MTLTYPLLLQASRDLCHTCKCTQSNPCDAMAPHNHTKPKWAAVAKHLWCTQQCNRQQPANARSNSSCTPAATAGTLKAVPPQGAQAAPWHKAAPPAPHASCTGGPVACIARGPSRACRQPLHCRHAARVLAGRLRQHAAQPAGKGPARRCAAAATGHTRHLRRP